MYTPIRPDRLYQKIVEQIQERILSGDLKAGDQLPSERELCEQFQVSRTAVREAVRALHEKGLVEVQPGRGTFITNGTSRAVRHSLDLMINFGRTQNWNDLVEVREMLEAEIAAAAAARATGDDITAMREAVETMETALGDADKYVEADLDFHLALAEATQNTIVPILIDSIVDMLRVQRTRIALVEGGLERGQGHHKHILEAIIQHNPAAAREAMRAHLVQVREDTEASTRRAD